MNDRTTPVYRPLLLGSDGDHLVVLGNDGRQVKFFRVINP